MMKEFKEFIVEKKEEKSQFDRSVTVTTLYKTDDEYHQFKQLWMRHGIAIGVIEKKLIIIDGEAVKRQRLSKDHLLFIQMHEIAHFKGFKKEADCDYYAIVNLWKKGFKKAAKIGVDEFEYRHGMSFPTEDLKGYR